MCVQALVKVVFKSSGFSYRRTITTTVFPRTSSCDQKYDVYMRARIPVYAVVVSAAVPKYLAYR